VKATIEPLEGNKVKVSVEVDEAEFDKAVDAAFRKIAREVRVPGFRPGKAPRKVLERRLGPSVGREQALHDSLPEFYAQALAEHDVDAIAPPEIDITAGEQGDGPLAFDAVVEVRPEVQVPGYGGLRVTLDRPEVTDEEIDAQIDRMRQVQATLAEVDRPAIDDDVVTIDITGTLDGEPTEGLTADDYSYTVGSGMVTPEVDENLRGAKPGDILSFGATHPDPDETRELEFRILVKNVNERVLPEVDDAWASENSEFETVEALRESIHDRMIVLRRAQANGQLAEKTTEALAKLVEDDVPDTLIDHEMQHRLQDLAMRLRAQGLSVEQWLAASGKQPDELTSELRESAAEGVKVDLALRAVADAEQIECDDDDLEAEIEAVAERVGETPDRVRSQFERGGQLPAVRSDIRKRKALDWLLERVEIVDQDGRAIDRSELAITTGDPDGNDDNDTGASGSAATSVGTGTDTDDTDETEDDTETDTE
jgi:trigger factor